MIRAALLGAALLLAASACGGSGRNTSSASASKLTDLHDIGQLRTLFNAHAGEPRLIVLVAPT
jgi:hypothetical protein